MTISNTFFTNLRENKTKVADKCSKRNSRTELISSILKSCIH